MQPIFKIYRNVSCASLAFFYTHQLGHLCATALNKWLKQTIGDGYVMHSFRHSIRDRLRAVNCPSEMIDQIGGWSKRSVGEDYGEGYSLDRCQCYLANAIKQH